MTFSVAPVGTGYLDPSALEALRSAAGAGGTAATSATSGVEFGSALTNAVDSIRSAQETSDALAVRAVTGDLEDVHAYTVASSQASLMLELAATVRTKGVDAFNEIMRMQA